MEVPAGARIDALELGGAIPVEGRRWVRDKVVEIRVLLPDGALQRLEATGRPVHRVLPDHSLGPPGPGYHSPGEGDALLAELAEASAVASLVTIGTSVQGRPIQALVLGRDPLEGAPTYRILGAHHGDEWSSFEVALATASALADPGADERISRILDRSTIWIVPYVNPDGVEIGNRLNANVVDLNRNYDYAWSYNEPFGGPEPFSEPETQAIRALSLHTRPMAGLSLHSGAINLGWVWNHTTDPAPEAELMEALAADYAARCDAPGFWFTNGAAWYITYGDTNDWSYGRQGVMDYTLELTDPKSPSPEWIPEIVEWHLDAILDFIDRPPSLSGTVLDPDGLPLDASLWLEGSTSSAIFHTDPETGRFHRITGSGSATLHVEAPGHAPRSLEIELDGTQQLQLQLQLQPVSIGSGWAEPSALAAPGWIQLPWEDTGILTLVQGGAPEHQVASIQGRAWIDVLELGPGWWTLVAADGTAFPRALWIDESERASIDHFLLADGVLEVIGTGFGIGTRAWAVVGPQRRRIQLPIHAWAPDRLVLGAPPGDGERVDVGLWSAGEHISLTDLHQTAATSTTTASAPPGEVGGCACGSMTGHLRASTGHLRASMVSILGTALLAFGRRRS